MSEAMDDLSKLIGESSIIGKLYQETQYQNGELVLIQYGLQRLERGLAKPENTPVRHSFICESIQKLAEGLANYRMKINHFDSWGEPVLNLTDISLDDPQPVVALRTSIGVEAPVSLVELAKLYSKYLAKNPDS